MFNRPAAYALTTLAFTSSLLTCAQFTNESAPFSLQVISYDNATLNGSSLYACHEGAAIEGVCEAGKMTMVPTSASTFNFNTSNDQTTPQDPSIGVSGILTYLLEGSNFNLSEPMALTYSPSSNVAHPQFQPVQAGTSVAFDSNNLLNIQDYVDDTVNPPSAGAVKAYYRWYICTTYTSSYIYSTLNWVQGSAPPQNPSCQKVDIMRVAE